MLGFLSVDHVPLIGPLPHVVSANERLEDTCASRDAVTSADDFVVFFFTAGKPVLGSLSTRVRVAAVMAYLR